MSRENQTAFWLRCSHSWPSLLFVTARCAPQTHWTRTFRQKAAIVEDSARLAGHLEHSRMRRNESSAPRPVPRHVCFTPAQPQVMMQSNASGNAATSQRLPVPVPPATCNTQKVTLSDRMHATRRASRQTLTQDAPSQPLQPATNFDICGMARHVRAQRRSQSVITAAAASTASAPLQDRNSALPISPLCTTYQTAAQTRSRSHTQDLQHPAKGAMKTASSPARKPGMF